MAILNSIFSWLIISLLILFCFKHTLGWMGVQTHHLPWRVTAFLNATGPLAAILTTVYLLILTFLYSFVL